MTLQAAWTLLGQHLQLAERLAADRLVEVDAPTLKAVTGWEPRLLMKFDSRDQRPPALAQATILPIRNGRYAIVACDGYHDLEEPSRLIRFRGAVRARRLVTLPWDGAPSSESQALDMALASGMLADFLAESELALTIRGRLRCPAFRFSCQAGQSRVELDVDGVQTEVDAGLEGEAIHLIEAKLGTRSDFHIRQLYYPYRLWSSRTAPKTVTGVFCCYSDRLFHLWQYGFEPTTDYHGIRLLKSASYSLDPEEGQPSIGEALEGTRPSPTVPDVPFPQADRLGRVIDLVEAVAAGFQAPSDLVERYGFTPRQADYYANAAQFLGLVARRAEGGSPLKACKWGYALSERGARLARASRSGRHRQILETLAALPVFRPALEQLVASRRVPSSVVLEEWIRASTPLSGSTVKRRAKTVVAWLRWALDASVEGRGYQALGLGF